VEDDDGLLQFTWALTPTVRRPDHEMRIDFFSRSVFSRKNFNETETLVCRPLPNEEIVELGVLFAQDVAGMVVYVGAII
jgi:hypothetical protein